jgi:hypothetical protein
MQELKDNEQQGPCCRGTDIDVDELLDDPELERLHRCAAGATMLLSNSTASTNPIQDVAAAEHGQTVEFEQQQEMAAEDNRTPAASMLTK